MFKGWTHMEILTQDDIQNTFVVVVGKTRFQYSLQELFKIGGDDLDNEYATQAAKYASVATLVARAEREVSLAVLNVEREYAAADEHARIDLVEQTGKTTEAAVKAYISMDEAYDKARQDEIEAKYVYRFLRMVSSALEMKSDMLISMGAQQRAEMGMTGISIKERRLENEIESAKRVLGEKGN